MSQQLVDRPLHFRIFSLNKRTPWKLGRAHLAADRSGTDRPTRGTAVWVSRWHGCTYQTYG
ncbi:hypothetical protein K1T71_002836 [Dendrolimus kikuchii]|uniref:Uncharacterized protein n=1 Tax=Dendrolimus kikuchii TaxID=765133 RepID=A0ACC1DDT8_9NEOP|nr:hypothetical protein K1T71_002836 [Dendrolimus kikuchii]